MVCDVFPRDHDVKVWLEGSDVNAGVREIFAEVVKEPLVLLIEGIFVAAAPVVMKPADIIIMCSFLCRLSIGAQGPF